MKILCFSDLHRDRDAAAALVTLAETVDVVIGAGDFATKHQGLSDTLELLSTITRPTVLVPGNGETFEELCEATRGWSSARVLHGQGCTIDGTEFWGVGGGIPVTPFGDWSYDFDEEAGATMLQRCPAGGVLVTHSPPLDTVDHDTTERIRGSQSIRACVEEKQPRLVVCGHIHGDWGRQARVGKSLILNAGPRGCVIELD